MGQIIHTYQKPINVSSEMRHICVPMYTYTQYNLNILSLIFENLYKQYMQMLKHSNHTDKLCRGFPRPPHSSLMIPKTDSQIWFIIAEGYIFWQRDTKQRQQKEMCMRQSPEETRHKLSRALSNAITQDPLKFLQQLVVTQPVKCHLPEAH